MKRLKALIIINPISGTKDSAKTEQLILKSLRKDKFDIEMVHTTRPNHAYEVSEEFADEVDIIFVSGGDGTVNQVSKALINSTTALGIFPCGSGNGIARSLGIPVNLNRAITRYNEAGEFKYIDTALFNNQPFVGVAGIGFDALVSHEFHNFEKRGLPGYIRAFGNNIMKYTPQRFEIEFDGHQMTETGFLAVIANSDQFGNNARISPLSKMDDGLLNLTLIRQMPKVLIPTQILRLFSGSLHKSPYVVSLEASSFTIRSEFKLAHLDGEPIKNSGETVVQVVPSSLKIYA